VATDSAPRGGVRIIVRASATPNHRPGLRDSQSSSGPPRPQQSPTIRLSDAQRQALLPAPAANSPAFGRLSWFRPACRSRGGESAGARVRTGRCAVGDLVRAWFLQVRAVAVVPARRPGRRRCPELGRWGFVSCLVLRPHFLVRPALPSSCGVSAERGRVCGGCGRRPVALPAGRVRACLPRGSSGQGVPGLGCRSPLRVRRSGRSGLRGSGCQVVRALGRRPHFLVRLILPTSSGVSAERGRVGGCCGRAGESWRVLRPRGEESASAYGRAPADPAVRAAPGLVLRPHFLVRPTLPTSSRVSAERGRVCVCTRKGSGAEDTLDARALRADQWL
jgi:hypothetical protein